MDSTSTVYIAYNAVTFYICLDDITSLNIQYTYINT